MKHIDIRYHFIKDHVEKGNVELFFVESERHIADLFTKAFDEKRHYYLLICGTEVRLLNTSVQDPMFKYKTSDHLCQNSRRIRSREYPGYRFNNVKGLNLTRRTTQTIHRFPASPSVRYRSVRRSDYFLTFLIPIRDLSKDRFETCASPGSVVSNPVSEMANQQDHPSSSIDPEVDRALIAPEAILPILQNNEYVNLTTIHVQHTIVREILRAHPLAYAMTATAEVSAIYIQQF
ncbi:hypothetical protein OSB04_003428 [Centaurea solstitialis]|uniref:Uncharacterized protein n=1 Tax=Centaurea solstitialis TaxID=347529 RepID=A0AA38UC26_9ASTR|nr:hypothetical protein OSB04_003428 [Centaurea solstitialis]